MSPILSFLFGMAIDPRLIMSPQFAEHLWITSASDGQTNYFINKKGKIADYDYTGGGMKMGGNEQRTIKNILNAVSGTDILNFKRTKKRDKSQWDITKVSQISGEPSTLGIATSPEWGWNVYFKDQGGKTLTKPEYQLIHHEAGHALGLSHPGERPTNPVYSHADTVMSYNWVTDSNGNVVPYGFTSSDAAALRSWWNTSGYQGLEYTQPESVGDFNVITHDQEHDHDHHPNKFIVDNRKFPSYNLAVGDSAVIDFAKEWKSNSEAIADVLREKARNSSPLKVRLSKGDDVIDLKNWSGAGLPEDVSVGHVIIHTRKGDDRVILRGFEEFSNGEFAKDVVISGGKGVDTVVIDDAFKFPNAKAGSLVGNRVIRFFGDSEKVETFNGAKVVNAYRHQGCIIRDDVEFIEINDKTYSFDELFDVVQSM